MTRLMLMHKTVSCVLHRKTAKFCSSVKGGESRDLIYVDDVSAVMVRYMLHWNIGFLNLAIGLSKSFY